MVNQFTGDFSYSIPLMDVEGYPITISYNSNVSMNDEASWVGLGWNLNVGSVAREMRGIPDDFDGTQSIARTYNLLEDDVTNGYKFGVGAGFMRKADIAGRASKIGTDLTALWGGYTNTYTGQSRTFDFNVSASLAIASSLDANSGKKLGLTGGLGYSRDSKNGIGRSSSLGVVKSYGDNDYASSFGSFGLSWGSNYNSRHGVTQRSINFSRVYGSSISASRIDLVGSTFTCGSMTSIPRLELNSTIKSSHNVLDLTAGFTKKAAKWGFVTGIETQIYNTDQTFRYANSTTQTLLNPAFGYFHAQKRATYAGSQQPVMDFNRERDVQFSEEMKNLPFSIPTYDVFYANGLGMAATFRGERDDIGVYHDGVFSNNLDGSGNNAQAGVEVVLPSTATEVNLKVGYVYTDLSGGVASGKWTTGSEVFQFGSDNGVYFKGIGEPTPRNTALLPAVEGTAPAYLQLSEATGSDAPGIVKTNTLVSANGTTPVTSAGLAALNTPEIRSTIYHPITATELGAVDTKCRVYPKNVFYGMTTTAFTRIDGTTHFGNHVSAVEIVSTDGLNYYYGLPTYSLNQSEVIFATDNVSADAEGLTTYTAGTDNSIGNAHGRSHLYDKTTVPGYSGAFLLTSVTTSDYVDLTGNGCSTDDIGNYYKINHTRVFDEANPFRWRFPMSGGSESNPATNPVATFNEGLLATDLDNMATYSYGEKEIWYTHSVESKNLVAEFTLEDREDVQSVLGENGKLDEDQSLQRLAKITLYNRSERLNNVNATPLQTIEFIYDYSLCPKTPTNKNTYNNPTGPNTGKLTLKEIRIYSGAKSEETALNPYVFTYASLNPQFHYKYVDRWGNYKPNTDAARPMELYPYAEQSVATANANAAAWKLTKIGLPMGAELEVGYEADSYSYVQNKRAMKHLDISGYTNALELAYLQNQSTWNGTSRVDNTLHKTLTVSDVATITGLTTSGVTILKGAAEIALISGELSVTDERALLRQLDQVPNNVVIFRLDQMITAASKDAASAIFREQYLKIDQSESPGNLVSEVYLRNMVKVKSSSGYELIPTFAKIKEGGLDFTTWIPSFGLVKATGVMPPDGSGNYNFGYIILDNVTATEDEKLSIAMSPVQKTALEFSRLHLTDIVYGSCAGCDADLTIDKKAFWHGDVYKEMAKYGYCKEISLTMPSQVRLFDANNHKMGGNARVAMVTIRDKWNTISGEAGAEYYWTYDYDRSSYGVAAYEPMTGNDENAFYAWDRYTNKSVSFPDESRFSVKPIGEMLYPSPVVGYRTVTLSLGGNQVLPTNQLGVSEATFATAKEHPTESTSTWIQRVDAEKTSIFKTEIDLFGFSQGHAIITNDFHGKPEDYRVYNANGDLQARTTYHYRVPGESVKMLEKDGVVSDQQIAMEYDIYADSRFIETQSQMLSVGLTLKFPLTPPSFIPKGFNVILSKNYRRTGFYAHTFNKHINYSATLERVETESLGSVNTAENLLYDKHTGNVLLSSLTDEYNEPLYSLNYPAHWYYTLFRNPLEQSVTAISGTLSGGTFTAGASVVDQLTVGDQVSLSNGGTPTDARVLSVSGSTAKLISSTTPFAAITLSGTYNLTVTQSGRKNIQLAMMQSVVTKRNPLSGSTLTFPTQDVIDVSAMTFKPRLNVLCIGSEKISVGPTATINPFNYGLLNNLVPEFQYALQVERSSSEVQGIRYNGTLLNYFPYFARNTTTGLWYEIDQSGHPNYSSGDLRNWRPMGEITTFDEYGRPLDSRDQIKVSSAVLYAYNRLNKLVPVAQAVNAKQHEIAFDSFEDYSYMGGSTISTAIGHFDYSAAIAASPTNVAITTTQKHSGLASLSVAKGITASVSRHVTPAANCPNPISEYTTTPFTVQSCMCVKQFEPVASGKYLIGMWVKGSAVNTSNAYSDVSVTISYTGSVTTATFVPTGQLLDGWQRVEGTFTIPGTATDIQVTLNNTSAITGTNVYFDDIRIHPFLAGMSTTVYDPATLLPMATHDGYNFTTFYGYDENLAPVRVRVETINGIQTISESEGSVIKDFKN